MSEENAPEAQEEENTTPPAAETPDDDTMPSAGKQIKVMAIIVVGITIVLGGGVWLSTLLR